ncbi:MAG: PLP-dependent transferase [Candidatus Aminicenantes bacterium]|nr:PLP-dependent transferase [Candidatus Aminicenantes bacterium]
MRFSTKAIHTGELSLEGIRPVVNPIFQTSNFILDEYAYEKMKEGKSREAWIYTRLENPTTRAVEEKIAALEGGEDAVVFSSGIAAIAASLLSFLSPSDHIVSSKDIYGGSYSLLNYLQERFDIKVTFANPMEPEGIIDAVTPKTKVFFFETLSNPLLKPFFIDGILSFAKKRGIKIIVDNTFLSPYNYNPLKKGADIVVHSLTKYIGGHSDIIAGAAVGLKEDIETIWHTMKTLGASPDPFMCFLVDRSIKTLGVRMERHNRNAHKIARFLQDHPKVEWVIYPMIENYYDYEFAKRNFKGGSGMIAFKIKGNDEDGITFMRSLKIIKEAGSLGGVESLVTMPALTSHASVSKEDRLLVGIEEGTIRLSVGLEDVEDLIKDLDQAFSSL